MEWVKKVGTFRFNLPQGRDDKKQKHSNRFKIESVKADLQLHS
jgi:hypothetical protein